MPHAVVSRVCSSLDRREFLGLPRQLYAGDSQWVPLLDRQHRELVGFSPHPFYANARIQTFIARIGRKPVGRIAAIVGNDGDTGSFGFFESVDDQEVAHAMFDAAREWLCGQGAHTMRGPMNPSMNYECGLLVDGFHTAPCFKMTYNPSYYPQLLESFGLTKAHDLFAYEGHIEMVRSASDKLHWIAEESVKRCGVTIRSMNKSHLAKEILEFVRIYNLANPGNWGYVNLSHAEAKHIAAGLRYLLVEELSAVAEANGQPVAVILGLPDFNPVIRRCRGRLFPWGFFQLIRARRRLKRMRLVSIAVLPEYQRWGLGVALVDHVMNNADQLGFVDFEMSRILESNRLSRGSVEKWGATKTKTYRIYQGPCDPTSQGPSTEQSLCTSP